MAKTEQLIEEQSTAWDILSTPFRTPAEIEWQDGWNAADARRRRREQMQQNKQTQTIEDKDAAWNVLCSTPDELLEQQGIREVIRKIKIQLVHTDKLLSDK